MESVHAHTRELPNCTGKPLALHLLAIISIRVVVAITIPIQMVDPWCYVNQTKPTGQYQYETIFDQTDLWLVLAEIPWAVGHESLKTIDNRFMNDLFDYILKLLNQKCEASMSRSFKVPRFQDSKIPRFQDYKIPRFHDFKIPRFQDFKISKFLMFQVSQSFKFRFS